MDFFMNIGYEKEKYTAYGMISLVDLARMTDWTISQLEHTSKTRPKLFDLLIRGAVSKKLESEELRISGVSFE